MSCIRYAEPPLSVAQTEIVAVPILVSEGPSSSDREEKKRRGREESGKSMSQMSNAQSGERIQEGMGQESRLSHLENEMRKFKGRVTESLTVQRAKNEFENGSLSGENRSLVTPQKLRSAPDGRRAPTPQVIDVEETHCRSPPFWKLRMRFMSDKP